VARPAIGQMNASRKRKTAKENPRRDLDEKN
jgi:hypothetical protein